MKEFEVTITETLQKSVIIEAESRDDALRIVEDMWSDGDIILDADHFAGVEYRADDGKEIEKSNTLEVLLVKPGQYAEMTTIDAGLSSMQGIVGGNIQVASYFDEPVVLVCNEEGKINGTDLNRAIKDDSGKIIDIVAGTFFVCGSGEDNLISLPPEHREKFEKLFKSPEAFLKMGKGVMAIPIEPKKDMGSKATKTKEQEL
ncbi:MAG TPA: DUF3846 domain-containing protein [Candidatus Ornithomonoglobus merdipullorum]|uniref:DUF3846 domain-containing protein n=1 Tax=Candidatus Ornithomonoglobus merdipullorum TaxID=2840895 RepID=A0A9D1MCP9_9FIRM|nr:DUF3846 domain-containing protein [Candidatus Ornithomonoglobus merdipullorum]